MIGLTRGRGLMAMHLQTAAIDAYKLPLAFVQPLVFFSFTTGATAGQYGFQYAAF